MSVTKTKTFKETNQWVIALLVAGTVAVAVIAFSFIPTLGWGKASALLWAVIGTFLTTIALQTESKNMMGVLALCSILLGSYAYMDSMRLGNEQPNCTSVEVSQVK